MGDPSLVGSTSLTQESVVNSGMDGMTDVSDPWERGYTLCPIKDRNWSREDWGFPTARLDDVRDVSLSLPCCSSYSWVTSRSSCHGRVDDSSQTGNSSTTYGKCSSSYFWCGRRRSSPCSHSKPTNIHEVFLSMINSAQVLRGTWHPIHQLFVVEKIRRRFLFYATSMTIDVKFLLL